MLKIYIVFFISLLIVLFYFEINKPKIVNWRPSFNKEHKRPWGTYVLYQELKNLFNDKQLEDIDITPYEQLRHSFNYTNNTCYLFINDYLNIDNKSINKLFDFVNQGNNVFMISNHLPPIIEDSLHLETKYQGFSFLQKDSTKISFYLTNQTFKNKKYFYKQGVSFSYFSKMDSTTSTILGYRNYNNSDLVNFIKVKFGKGYFYLHLQPFAFTNYYMLKNNNSEYIGNVLSYIDAKTIYWDRKNKSSLNAINHPLRFIFSKPALAWAWRLGLFTFLIFVLFTIKRKQRIIPIKNPLKNTSVAFVKTIANLYYQEGKPKDIVSIKINYFLEDIRKTYMLDTQHLNDDFKKRLHHKTGIEQEEINRLINYLILLNERHNIEEYSLVILNKLIEKFYRKTKYNGK